MSLISFNVEDKFTTAGSKMFFRLELYLRPLHSSGDQKARVVLFVEKNSLIVI